MQATPIRFFKLVFLSFVVSLFSSPVFARPKTPDHILLNTPISIPRDPVYGQIVSQAANSLSENVKIAYLISRIRNSPYRFVRNGSLYTGMKAASHISLKYRRRVGRIKTAQDFIREAASYSLFSGQPYLLRMPEGDTYPVKDILLNELSVLETSLLKDPALEKNETGL